jgi:hypothetical protein
MNFLLWFGAAMLRLARGGGVVIQIQLLDPSVPAVEFDSNGQAWEGTW